MLVSVNLSLSVLCNARCVYCPQDRGENLKAKIMPISIIRKITAELTAPDCKHNIKIMQLSENGDALLNKDFIEILRILKRRLPSVQKILYTNLSLLTKKKSEIIVREGLIDKLMCSIDSVDEDVFSMMNGMSLKRVLQNFKDFLSIRDKLNSPITVNVRVLTLHNYVKAIKHSFGFVPNGVDKFRVPMLDEVPLIAASLERFMDSSKDKIEKSIIFAWNDREKFTGKVDSYTSNLKCPFLDRNEHDLFIAPDGSCYSCCLDSKCDIIFGNVNSESLDSIFNSSKRARFLEKLRARKFIEIGGACSSVICCQSLQQ